MEQRVRDPVLPGQERTWEGDSGLALSPPPPIHCCPAPSSAPRLQHLQTILGQRVFLFQEGLILWGPRRCALPMDLAVHQAHSPLVLGLGNCMVFLPVPYEAALQTGCVPSSAWGLPLSLPTVTSPHSDMARLLVSKLHTTSTWLTRRRRRHQEGAGKDCELVDGQPGGNPIPRDSCSVTVLKGMNESLLPLARG